MGFGRRKMKNIVICHMPYWQTPQYAAGREVNLHSVYGITLFWCRPVTVKYVLASFDSFFLICLFVFTVGASRR